MATVTIKFSTYYQVVGLELQTRPTLRLNKADHPVQIRNRHEKELRTTVQCPQVHFVLELKFMQKFFTLILSLLLYRHMSKVYIHYGHSKFCPEHFIDVKDNPSNYVTGANHILGFGEQILNP